MTISRRIPLVALVVALLLGLAQVPAGAATAPNTGAGQPVPFGTAGNFGSVAGLKLQSPIVGMASTPTGLGYWLVASDGGIFAFGDAAFYGSTGNLKLVKPVVGMASTPSGHGYWLVASDGGIFAFGDAAFYGSTGALKLAQPVVGMAPTPTGHGYWMVASDGGIFSFGDAAFYGSTGALKLVQPVVAMAPTPTGHGYWMVASDGGIFSFGDGVFRGSMGGTRLQAPVVDMAATPSGGGYTLAAADGGVFTFGDARFVGSLGGQQLGAPIGAMATTPDGLGLWLLPIQPPPTPAPASGPAISGSIFNLSDIPGHVYAKGQKVAALTFDDGPNPTYTPQILRVLEQYHAPAAFQIVGNEGAANRGILNDEVAGGFTLASHTWTHADLTKLTPAGWASEVDRTTDLLQSVTGKPLKCLRPPYGYTNASVLSQLTQRGLAQLMWDVDPTDYNKPGASVITSRVLGALHPGAIILMHDGGGDRSQTVAALPAIIQGIRAAGYTLVPVCN